MGGSAVKLGGPQRLELHHDLPASRATPLDPWARDRPALGSTVFLDVACASLARMGQQIAGGRPVTDVYGDLSAFALVQCGRCSLARDPKQHIWTLGTG